MRVLVAEDDPILNGQIKSALLEDGHAIDVVDDGEEAYFMGSSEPYDVIILDIGMPKRDGISVLKQLRKDNVETPVLILTARDGWSERVDGLDAGADDYMSKPFYMPELSARIRALIRRKSHRADPVFKKGNVVYDSRNNCVLVDGMIIQMTAQELSVLSYLFHNAGRMISRTELSDHIYEYDCDKDSNTIAVFVNRIRKKLGKDLIQSKRGLGYQIDPD